MAPAALSARLSQLQSNPSQQRAEDYNNVLQSILAQANDLEEHLVAYVQSITSDSIGVIQSRPLLSSFADKFRDISDNDVKISAGYVFSNNLVQ